MLLAGRSEGRTREDGDVLAEQQLPRKLPGLHPEPVARKGVERALYLPRPKRRDLGHPVVQELPPLDVLLLELLDEPLPVV